MGPVPRQRLGEHRATRARTPCPTGCPRRTREPLWEALRDGTIDLVSTDHGPHTREEKEPGWTDGWKAHTGTPSAQFYVPLFLDAACRGRITLERVVDAHRHGPGPDLRPRPTRAGSRSGADADIAIVDLEREFEIRDEDVLSKIGWTPYAGRRDPRRRRHDPRRAAASSTTTARSSASPAGAARHDPPADSTTPHRRSTSPMATRFGLLVPHFGVEADQDLLDRGRPARRPPRLRLPVGARSPRLPPARHGRHGPDVHRAVRHADLPRRRDRADRPRRGDDHPVPPPDQHGLQRRLDVVDDPSPVRSRDRRRQLPARVRRDRPGRPQATGADEGADPHRPPAVDRRVGRVAQRPVRLRRRRPQAAAGPPGPGLVGRRDAGLGPPRGRLLRGLAARPDHLPDLRGARRQDPRDDRRAGQADDHDRRRAGHQHRHVVRGGHRRG